MKNLILFTSLVLLSLANTVFSQCGPVATPYNQNNGQDGIMFDIAAINTVEITNFDVNCGGATHDFEIYYKAGTHVGFEGNAGAWTLLATANNVTGPVNVATPIPVNFSIIIPGCETYGFYITSTGAGSIDYTNGTAVGNVLAADANIQILEGTGKDYPFAASFSPRNPNITTYYNCVGNGCCALTNITAVPGACDPVTGTYSTTGQIDFVGAPAGGTLTVTDCNGVQQVFNAPFVSPLNYSLSGQAADGMGCDVTAVFSADPTCTVSETYTAPMCAPCNIDVFTINTGFCQDNNTYMMDGSVEFSNSPAGGTLVIQVDNGTSTYDTIINPPFVSPANWSISGIPSDGSASTITVFFSNDMACTATQNYNAPQSCLCNADIGTFTPVITGVSTNNYVLCYGDQIDITSNGDWTDPGEAFAPPGPAYDPGVTWMIYSCPPSVAIVPDPVLGLMDDPCFIGAYTDFDLSDFNDLSFINSFPVGTFTDNTIYWVPVTMYSMATGTYSYVNTTMPCYELGNTYAVQYLPEITSIEVADCQLGTVTSTINGGLPEVDGSDFTASNLSPPTASFTNTTTPNGGTIEISGLQSGDMYSFDVMDANGCPITISGGPFTSLEDPSYNYAQTVFCTSDPVENAVINGTPGGTFTSTPGLSLDAVTGQITPSTSTPGNYNVTYTTPDLVCFQDSIIPIVINGLPVVNAGVDQTICDGDPVTLSGTGATAYVWDNGVTDGVAFNPNATVTYTVTGTDANNCQNTDQVDVIVNTQDDPSFDYPLGLTYCQSAADPTGNITGTAGGNFSFVVAAGGPTLSMNTGTGDIVLATSDLGTYDITYQTTGLCPNSSTLQLVITDAPVSDFQLDIYCANDIDPLPTYLNGGSGGTFTSTPGLILNPATGEIDLDASTAGVYTITNTINIAGCAISSFDDDITINEIPDATISGSTTICQGDPLPDLTIDIIAGAANWSIDYNLDGALVNVPVIMASPYTISNAAIGTYDLVSITDNNGCSNTIFGQAIIGLNPSPVIDPVSNQDICEGDLLNIGAFSSDIPGSTFAWSNLTGSDIGFGLSGNGDILGFTALNNSGSDETVTIEVTPTSPAGCLGSPISFDISSHPIPTVLFTAIPLSGCEPLTVDFTNLSFPVGGANCVWNFGDGNTASTCGNPTNIYNAGTYDVSLTVTSSYGCTNSDTYVDYIDVNVLPNASFSYTPQTTTVEDGEIEFTNSSINADTYVWSFGDQSATEGTENPIHQFPTEVPGQYTVQLIAINGDPSCSDTAEVLLVVDDVIVFFVPNIFTPDGDNFNETFQPIFTSGYDPYDFHMAIYNRWGEIVFETYDASIGWDGTYGDQGLVQDGVYVWKIEFKETMSDKRHKHNGHVTVLK